MILGKYVGEPTEHKIIPFGKGICGQSAKSKKTTLVNDVLKTSNYLSCSIKVKSEIVIPIFDKDNNFVGELDIDSHQKEIFSIEDETFLKQICAKISVIF